MQAQDYVLDTEVECDRLERQGLLHGRERVLEHVSLPQGSRFLDAGSGSGWVARTVAATFPQSSIIGIDLNPTYVDYARRLGQAEGLDNLTFVAGDLQVLPFDDGSFDQVWSQFVLYFVPDPEAVLREFRRVTKPGGLVCVAFHDEPLGRLDPPDPELDEAGRRIRQAILGKFESRQVPMMFQRAGLVDVDVEIETDQIYTSIGSITAERRRNVEEMLSGPIRKFSYLFGSAEGAERFLARRLAYLDRPDTSSITAYWVVKGRVP